MAILVNNSSGNFTSASTWSVVDSGTFTPVLATQETGTTATTTSFTGLAAGFSVGLGLTVDGIMMKLSTRGASGTVSVRIYNVTGATAVAGTTVTINATDMTAGISWVQFKFAAPVNLNLLTTYRIEASSSVASGATFYRKSATASDWTFGLRTTTNQAPGSGDQLIVTGDYVSAGVNNSYTVTMDNTATTTFGPGTTGVAALELNDKSSFVFGSNASTNYYLKLAGDLVTNINAIYSMGTSLTPIPATSTAFLEFLVASNIQFGFIIRNTATITTYGASKTTKAYLAANIAAAATSLTTSVSTGWKSGDLIAIATTNRNVIAESETATLNGDASGTTVNLVSGVGFAHLGSTTTNSKAEIINLTRNVRIFGQSTTLGAYILVSGVSSIVSFNYTDFQYLGSATASKRGIDVGTTTGSFNMLGCSLRNFEVASSYGINLNSTSNANITISDVVMYRIANTGLITAASTASTITIDNVWVIGGTAMGAATHINIAATAGSFTNLNAAGAAAAGITLSGTITTPTNLTYSNLIAHGCVTIGIQISNISTSSTPVTLTNLIAWRNQTRGIFISGSNLHITNGQAFGNVTNGMEISGAINCSIDNLSFVTDVGAAQTVGIGFTTSSFNNQILNCQFGVLGLTHSTGDLAILTANTYHYAVCRNCLFASTTEIATQTNLLPAATIGSSRHDQTAGVHKMWSKFGTISSDTSLFYIQSPSVRLTPNSATNKLQTQPMKVAVPSGKSAKINVAVRRSVAGDGSAYNGNLPRLQLLAQQSAGISSDVVLSTATAGSLGAFEILLGTTSSVTDDTVLNFIVDCDGTAGWVNVDYWKVEIV